MSGVSRHLAQCLAVTYAAQAPTSEQLMARARSVIPGGVSSPVRAFGAVGGTPRFMQRGAGARVWDVDDREYVDLVGSWGPMIVGHNHEHVMAAVQAAMSQGVSFGAPTEAEVLLAEEIVDRIGVIEQVRFVNSGTEACMSAVRLARGVTGRDMVVKFAGHYHGHMDALLASAGSGVATLGLPDSPGVPSSATQETLVLPYNDEAALQAAFAEHGDRIACVVAEAAAGNMGVVPPAPGFAELIRTLTQAHGALWVSDEVMTGFRASRRGWWGCAELTEGAPDLMVFGKVMGGGFPAAAFGGSAEVMGQLAPLGPVYQAGTLSGNPVAMAAGLATLKLLDDAAYDQLRHTAGQVVQVVSTELTQAGVAHRVQWAGTMFCVFFCDHQVRSYADAQRQNGAAHRAFFHAMLAQGVYVPPSMYETWFVSTVMTGHDVDQIATAARVAARAAAAA